MTQEQKKQLNIAKAATAIILKLVDTYADVEYEEPAGALWNSLDALEAAGKCKITMQMFGELQEERPACSVCGNELWMPGTHCSCGCEIEATE